MAISKKGRRKLIIDGRLFFWRVSEFNEYELVYSVGIVSEDQRFAVAYCLNGDGSWIHCGGWSRFEAPRFDNGNGIITPGGIRRLIEWRLSQTELTPIDQFGKRYPRIHIGKVQ